MRALVLAFLLAPLSAQEIWVDAVTGSDLNPGTPTQPLQSITAGLAAANPNSTVYVRPGVYSVMTTNERFPLQIGNGLTQDGLTLYAFEGAVLDLANAAGMAIQVGNFANGGRITGLTIANMDQSDWWARAINAGTFNGQGSSTGFEIDRCRFVDVNRGIVLWQGTPILGWRIHDNLFLRLGNDGINEFDLGSANLIHDNTFAGGAHLGVLSDADQTLVVNNVFTGLRVGVASGAGSAAASARVRSNSFWQNTRDVEGAAFPNGLPGANLTVDPLFVNPANDDHRLLASSPLIDAGDPLPGQRADLDRVAGQVDGNLDGLVRTDIGAYEFTPVRVTASATNAVNLSFQIVTNSPSLAVAAVVFGLDEGLIPIPGMSPILIAPGLMVPDAFVAVMPYSLTMVIPPLQPGTRIVVQGFGFDPGGPRLVSGAAVRLQF
jgi:hypothetical protein